MVVGMFLLVRCEAVLVFLREVVERESDGGDWLTEVVRLGDGSYRRPRQVCVDWLRFAVTC